METVKWASAHYEEPFHTQRTAKLPGKLRRLGVLDLPRSARVLDACCGKGEALEVLRKEGFTRLDGLDGMQHPEWSSTCSAAEFARSDVRQMPFESDAFDAVVNLHALHHFTGALGVATFVTECARVLRPGGSLFILDFPGSPQIKLLFWILRHGGGWLTPGLRNFTKIVDEEWSYLQPYLAEWSAVEGALRSAPLSVKRWRRGLFLYELELSKALPS